LTVGNEAIDRDIAPALPMRLLLPVTLYQVMICAIAWQKQKRP
jgi:hypothetical protein